MTNSTVPNCLVISYEISILMQQKMTINVLQTARNLFVVVDCAFIGIPIMKSQQFDYGIKWKKKKTL